MKYIKTLCDLIERDKENARLYKKIHELKQSRSKLKQSHGEQHEKICEIEKEKVHIRRMHLEAEEDKIQLEKELNDVQKTVVNPNGGCGRF